ncbi:phytase [Kordiimonas aestuarii]|uniref:phytase n=1 Tax=Kordiimonas aestuarii TaxID=1005925 RepID=UPI0021D31D07|nr:phytase [Kordiimonas aestuarii]
MRINRHLATVAVIGLAACSPKENADTPTTGAEAPSVTNVTVSLETAPSSSDSASAALVWPGESGGATYILGAVEDGIEVYDAAGLTLSKTDGGEIESFDLIHGFGANSGPVLFSLDTSNSTVSAFTMNNGTLTPVQADIIQSEVLLEGMCAHKSPLDGEAYAFLLGSGGQIEQWNIFTKADGTVSAKLVRTLQLGTEPKFCVADSRSNSVYVTEEAVGVWRFDADVEAETVPELIDVKKFGHFTGEVGGLALHHTEKGQTVLFASDVETSQINLYDVTDDHRYVGSAKFSGAGSIDAVENAGSLFAGSGYLVLADEDNGEEATNFKLAKISDIASAFNFDQLTERTDEDPSGAFALVKPSAETAPVADGGDAADDPAIWVHPTDPGQSLIIGTNKQGGIYVYNLDGSVHQYVPDGRMNNVDLRYNVKVGDRAATLVVASNRTEESISIYELDEQTGKLQDIADGIQKTDMPDPYGLCLYQSPKDGSTYVFMNEKGGLVRQWQLGEGNPGKVKATAVREFEVGSTAEGCVADDDTGALFVAEEDIALWKYGAEPGDGTAREKITDPQMNHGLKDDLEGVSIYYGAGTSGYIVLSSQGNNSYALFDREAPHAYVGSFRVIANSDAGIDGSSETDGLDIISTPLGPDFPYGVFVAQDGRNISPAERQNFKLVPWEHIADKLSLEKYTGRDPRK